MAIFSVKDWGATGLGTVDDTAAIVSCINYAASITNNFQAGIKFPTGKYLISDGKAGTNNAQFIQITGTGTSFTISVTLPPGIVLTTGTINYTGSGNTNASNMQTALAALPGLASVTVNYQADPNWYVVQFGPQMGQPGLAASGASLTFVFMKGNPNQQALAA